MQARASTMQNQSPAGAVPPGPAISVQAADIDMRISSGIATGFIPSAPMPNGQAPTPSLQELANTCAPSHLMLADTAAAVHTCTLVERQSHQWQDHVIDPFSSILLHMWTCRLKPCYNPEPCDEEHDEAFCVLHSVAFHGWGWISCGGRWCSLNSTFLGNSPFAVPTWQYRAWQEASRQSYTRACKMLVCIAAAQASHLASKSGGFQSTQKHRGSQQRVPLYQDRRNDIDGVWLYRQTLLIHYGPAGTP